MADAIAEMRKQMEQTHQKKVSRQVNIANAALRDVGKVVKRAIVVNYGDMNDRRETGKSLGTGGSGTLAMMAFITVVFPVAVWTIAGAFAAIGTLAVFGSLLATKIISEERYKQPNARFNFASRELTSAVSKIEDDGIRKKVERLSNSIRSCFVLGKVASLQKQIVEGNQSEPAKRKMRNQGIKLIDRASAKLHWTDGEELKEKFNKNSFPEVSSAVEEFQKNQKAFESDFPEIIRNIHPKFDHSVN